MAEREMEREREREREKEREKEIQKDIDRGLVGFCLIVLLLHYKDLCDFNNFIKDLIQFTTQV